MRGQYILKYTSPEPRNYQRLARAFYTSGVHCPGTGTGTP